LWQPVLLFFSFFTLLQQGRKMVRGWWWHCWRLLPSGVAILLLWSGWN
jgi:hypothetical protein